MIDENTVMEVKGMENVQKEIMIIEKRMEMVFVASLISGIISVIIVIILTTKFITKPISKLIEITKTIAKGEFINTYTKSKNSDVNDLLVSINEMSKDLEKYRTAIRNQEKLSSIGELASSLAHDIRNPLTVIKGTLDVIKTQNKNLTPEDLEKFERVDSAMYRITHQIDNVLDFIKGKPLKFQKYSIKEILDSVIVDLPKSNEISIEIVSEESEIECDFEAMKVILINLTINAIQAIKDEGKIKISSKIRGDKVIIEVEDSGPGIPEETLEKIFEPLYTTKEEGTGLGLVSCKSLVDQHHGKISVKNNPTRFIIELPKNIQQKTK
jgi:signal transduction histidine kinase